MHRTEQQQGNNKKKRKTVDKSIKVGSCGLTYNFCEIERPRWDLYIDVNESVGLTLGLVDAVLLHNVVKRSLDGEPSWETDDYIAHARRSGCKFDILRTIPLVSTGELVVHIAQGSISVFISLVRMGQFLDDLTAVFIESLGKEPELDKFVPATV